MLEVEVATTNGTAICLPKGDLDATTLSSFRGAVGLCLCEPGLIVDLSGVGFIDGAGLSALVGVVCRAREQRGRVAVVVPPGSLRTVLGEAGLDRVVTVSETVDLALAEMHHHAGAPEPVHGDPRPSSTRRARVRASRRGQGRLFRAPA